jgi:hypothetical protein
VSSLRINGIQFQGWTGPIEKWMGIGNWNWRLPVACRPRRSSGRLADRRWRRERRSGNGGGGSVWPLRICLGQWRRAAPEAAGSERRWRRRGFRACLASGVRDFGGADRAYRAWRWKQEGEQGDPGIDGLLDQYLTVVIDDVVERKTNFQWAFNPAWAGHASHGPGVAASSCGPSEPKK